MNKYVKSKLMLFVMPVVFAACNGGDKTTTTESTTDSTKMNKVDTTSIVQNMDAAKVAPDRYEVVKDTLGIRILKITYKPGDSSLMHSHPDNALYVVDGGKSQFTAIDGSKQVYEMSAGMTNIGPAETHSVKNIGTTTTHAYLVEVNRPNTAVPIDPAMDPVKTSPNLYKVLRDSMNIRILMATYPPGSSSKLHAHPDNAIYIVEGGSAEFSDKDGTKRNVEMVKGTASVRPAEAHAVKNTGKGTMKVLLVEVNRPAK